MIRESERDKIERIFLKERERERERERFFNIYFLVFGGHNIFILFLCGAEE